MKKSRSNAPALEGSNGQGYGGRSHFLSYRAYRFLYWSQPNVGLSSRIVGLCSGGNGLQRPVPGAVQVLYIEQTVGLHFGV